MPDYISARHRQQLRRRILGEIGNKRTIPVPDKIWNIAVAAVVLVCLGGAVGTVIDVRYRNAGRQADSIERPISEDSQNVYVPNTAILEANGVMEAVQTATEPAEADLVPEQDDIEVVIVGTNDHSPLIEVEAGGHPDNRSPLRYAVAKGRRTVVGVSNQSLPLTRLSQVDWAELSQLRQTGKGENLGTQERQWKGRAFVFQRERYTLRNGTRVIVSAGVPKDAP
jgi:hypothetical protein